MRIVSLFDFNLAFNIPTVFASSLFLMTSILLFKTGNRKNEISAPWYGLGFFFVMMTGSKALQIHKIFIWITRRHILTDSTSWIVFSVIAFLSVILLVRIYRPFLSKLPKDTLRLMLLSIVIFVFGAFVLDWLGGLHREIHGIDLTYKIYYTVEETVEMVGVSLFIFALMRYRVGSWKLEDRSPKSKAGYR